MSNIKTDYALNFETKRDAFPYQAEAFSALKDLDYCAIFHEQGLGKTKIAIDLGLYWITKRSIDTVMIVTKKQLIKNWVDEFKFHTYLKPKTLGAKKGDNFMVLNSMSKVIITNFETIVSELERIKLFLKSRDVAIIIDESTKIKNPDSNLAKIFFEISDMFRIRTIMTGTPVANRPYDIWSQIYFLDKGKSLGTDFIDFKKNTDLKNNLGENEELRRNFEDAVSSIYESIRSFSVRETKKSCSVVLPKKNYFTIYSSFECTQNKMYEEVLEEYRVEIEKNGEKILDNSEASLKRLLRLNQITSNPKLIDDSYNNCSGKEEQLSKLIKQIIARDEKCIIWSSFIDNIEQFSKRFKEYKPRKIHGRMTIDERNKSIDIFKNDNECKLLFATPQAAKEGLTLTVANNAIFYDRTFNLDDYLQAQDRIHRISQKKECNIYNLMINDSIDLWIDSLLSAKQYAAFLAQGDIPKDEYQNVANYEYGEIIKMILKEDK